MATLAKFRTAFGKDSDAWRVFVAEDPADGFEVCFHETPVGLNYGELRDAALVVDWLQANFEDAMAMADGVEGWSVVDPRRQPTPPSIADDLKTPEPGAVEGAEVTIEVPKFGSILDALGWIDAQPPEVQREINRGIVLHGLRSAFERQLAASVEVLFQGLPK